MSSSRPWNSVDEFLDLFGVDKTRNGVIDFMVMVDTLTLLYAFPEYGCFYEEVAARRMAEVKLSPLTYYQRIKCALRPIFSTSVDTFKALGFVLPEGFTTPMLVKAIARLLARDLDERYRKLAKEAAYLCKAVKK